ncbi:DNA cytosine methyltransferase [Metapseudomonas otitidis]|uniref:DNA cytosine methyltransferase n=1 Tax=Metapseudomonas otitidis TaxID=319939 RepID=UPI0008EAC688|nr:DNA cytosine methyltransferase [Pseudomonas otitidis]SFA41610.1 DNA (cytosine-5)-methyltransferase 1 [Pseudomonas otitidis]
MNHIHKADTKPFYAIDLFSGCGGLTLGLKKAGFLVTAAVEIDSKAQETYKLNHPKVKLYNQDIRKLDPLTVLKDLNLKPGDLDLLAGCPPCQGFSRLRTKNQNTSVQDERNELVSDFLRFIALMQPKTVMLENVPALAKDSRFLLACEKLESLGYKITSQILDTADYSVPQRRKRLIMLASKTHSPSIADKSKKRITVRQALNGLESAENTTDSLHGMGEKRSQEVRKIISLVPKNGGSRRDLPEIYQLNCHKRCKGFYDVYGRMSWEDVAPTITSGCHNPSKGRFIHPEEDRTITLREAAILQGFPKKYKFNIKHGKESIALMIGNALPPPFIAAHASALKKGLVEAQLSREEQKN